MSSLSSKFDQSRQLPEDGQWHLMRAEYFIQANVGDGAEFYPCSVRSAYSSNIQNMVEQKKRDKQSLDHAMMALSNRLKDIENRLIDKYGEYFAENLAAEHLDESIYKQLMTIQDQDERREKIAQAINEGLKNGSVDSHAINQNPEFVEWLEVRQELKYQRSFSNEQDQDITHDLDQTHQLEKDLDSILPP